MKNKQKKDWNLEDFYFILACFLIACKYILSSYKCYNESLMSKFSYILDIFITYATHKNAEKENLKKNYLFLSIWLHKLGRMIIFICLLSLTILGICFQFLGGHIYRPHHIINNILTLPLIVFSTLKYMDNLNNKYDVIEIVNAKPHRIIINLSPVILQMVWLFLIAFMSSYDHTPATNIINVDTINIIYLTFSLYFIMISAGYLISFLSTKEIRYDIKYISIFPWRIFLCGALFFIIWSLMVYYEHENRMESTFYFSEVFFSIFTIFINTLCFLKYKSENGLFLYWCTNIGAMIMIIYSCFVNFLESIEFAPVIQKDSPPNSTINIILLVFLIAIVILIFLIPQISQKYRIDCEQRIKK